MAEAVAIKTEPKVTVSYAEPIAEQRAALSTKKIDLDGAITNLLQHEKTARLGGDIAGTTELCTAMVEMCFEAKQFTQLNETLQMLAKRRAQVKEAVGAMVRKGSEYAMDDAALPDDATRLALIEALRAVSEGKMFVEVERARLTRKLAQMLEAEGKMVDARKIMIETVVETLGGMGKREKTDFILEQVRLCLDTDEFVRAQIMARKINVKVFKDDEIEDLELRFYKLIVRYHLHEHTWMEIYRAYESMWGTPSLQSSEEERTHTLKCMCIYLMLSPFDKDRTEQLHVLNGIKYLADLPMYKELVRLFTTQEIFHFGELKEALSAELSGSALSFDAKEVELMLTTFHRRVTEHNLGVVSAYYARITMERLSGLLELDISTMEEQLCEMVTNKQVYAKIDRPKGLVVFAQPKTPTALLNDWSTDISSLLTMLEGTCHLIHKENMIHKIS